jgi:general secretion pathway protein C
LPLPASPRWLHRHAPTLLGLALIIAISISLAWQTADWIRLTQAPPAAPENPDSAVTENVIDPQLALLFGSSASQQGPAPSTDLRLTLLGSFVNPDPQHSSAIILNGNTAQRYSVGSEISSGVTLHSVSTNQVELMRNGRRESLSFPVAQSNAFNPTGEGYAAAAEEALTPEQLEVLESDDLKQLRERMRELQQQMHGSSNAPEPADTSEPATESQ